MFLQDLFIYQIKVGPLPPLYSRTVDISTHKQVVIISCNQKKLIKPALYIYVVIFYG